MSARSLLASSSALVLLMSINGAGAADITPFEPPVLAPAPAPVRTWTGLYVGAYGGYTMGTLDFKWDTTCVEPNSESAFNININSTGSLGDDIFELECFGMEGKDGETADFSWEHEFGYEGFSAGGLIGLNLQLGNNFLVGVEGFGGWTDQEGDIADLDFRNASFEIDFETGVSNSVEQEFEIDNFAGGTLTAEFSKEWEAGVRGRLGYIAQENTLLYVLGGVSWTEVELTTNINFNDWADGLEGLYDGKENETLFGYQVGGGIEHRFANSNWTVRLEGFYSDYESIDIDFDEKLRDFIDACESGAIDPCFVAENDFEDGGDMDSEISWSPQDLTLRAAVTYQFNWPN